MRIGEQVDALSSISLEIAQLRQSHSNEMQKLQERIEKGSVQARKVLEVIESADSKGDAQVPVELIKEKLKENYDYQKENVVALDSMMHSFHTDNYAKK